MIYDFNRNVVRVREKKERIVYFINAQLIYCIVGSNYYFIVQRNYNFSVLIKRLMLSQKVICTLKQYTQIALVLNNKDVRILMTNLFTCIMRFFDNSSHHLF